MPRNCPVCRLDHRFKYVLFAYRSILFQAEAVIQHSSEASLRHASLRSRVSGCVKAFGWVESNSSAVLYALYTLHCADLAGQNLQDSRNEDCDGHNGNLQAYRAFHPGGYITRP